MTAARQLRTAVLTGVFLGAAACLGPGQARAACTGLAVDPVVPPAVQFLRSYRVEFSAPSRLAADVHGNLYITDPPRGEVVVRAPDGAVLRRVPGLGNPVSIAADGLGLALVGDGTDGRVSAYGPDWRRLFDLGQGAGEFGFPGDIALDRSTGEIYVTDTRQHRVRVYDRLGTPLRSFGGPGREDGLFDHPTGIFVTTAGEVLVVDQLNFRVQAFDRGGSFLWCLAGTRPSGSFFGGSGGPARPLNLPQGIWADERGRIYVAEAFQGKVLVMDRRGVTVGAIGTFGEAPGQLRVPTDVALDGYGRLYVAAANNGRIEVYGLDTYNDPERVLPGLLGLAPARLNRGEPVGSLVAQLRVPGYPLAELDTASIALNGVAPTAVAQGDADGDGVPELRLDVPADALLATLPAEGNAPVELTAMLGTMEVRASAALEVVAAPSQDADGDGVDEPADACPDTPAGEVTDATGCSIAQRCPCEAQASGKPWRNHAAYVSCVARSAQLFAAKKLIDRRARFQIVMQAVRDGQCGRQETRASRGGGRR